MELANQHSQQSATQSALGDFSQCKVSSSSSDIDRLFSKLPFDANHYQEIGNFQGANRNSPRWNLVDEITNCISKYPEIEKSGK